MLRTACERMNQRAERLIGRNTLRGLKRVKAYIGIAQTLKLLIAAASYRNGKPRLARSIEYTQATETERARPPIAKRKP